MKRYLFAMIVAALFGCLSGCQSDKGLRDSKIPWGRPAGWESNELRLNY